MKCYKHLNDANHPYLYEAVVMAKNSVSRFELTDNDVCCLGNIILNELEYYRHHVSPFFENFRVALNTIAGLGYTTILADHDEYLLAVYQRYLKTFLENRVLKKEFLTDYHTMAIAQSIGHMIQLACLSFRATQFPDYFESFCDHISILMSKLAVHGAIDLAEDSEKLCHIFLSR